MHNFIMF